jgi:hypothetical protein
MGCVLVHDHDKTVWNLASGTWMRDETVGYILKSTPNSNVENHVNPHFVQQMLNLPTLAGKVYPPEFLYDPETGNALEKSRLIQKHIGFRLMGRDDIMMIIVNTWIAMAYS